MRVTCDDDISRMPQEQVAWVETTPRLACRPELQQLPLDVVLTDPRQEAAGLYRLAREHPGARVTIPALDGMEQAAMIAMALQLPVRLLPGQPDEACAASLERILDRYLHDPHAESPVEFFHAALARLLVGHAASLWEVLECDPDLFPRLGVPHEEDFVRHHLERTLASGADCATCPFLAWCQGCFKWPQPDYDCTHVRRLLGRLEDAADQLRGDARLAEALVP